MSNTTCSFICHVPTKRWVDPMHFVASPVPEEHRLDWKPIDNPDVLDKLAALAMLRYNGEVEGVGIAVRLTDVTEEEAAQAPEDYRADMAAMANFPRHYAWVEHVQPADDEDREELAYVKQYAQALGEKDSYWSAES